jgi:molybdate/tungstate transport system substrate-binding protein
MVALLLAVACDRSGPGPEPAEPTTLTIFHAGSLAVPFRQLGAAYEKRYPGTRVRAEAAGSRDTARKVSDLGRPCDVLASADYRVVENLLLPQHAAFHIRFATNAMAIAYGADSTGAAELSATTWPDVLLRDDVRFGRADPNRDPCGYRTEMVFQLAERHYDRPGLAGKLAAKHGRKYIRPKETDLLALLEAGEIDYLFIYRSVAKQHGLQLLELPPAINLEDPKLAHQYSEAKVRVTGRKPGELLEQSGTPINYSVTIPRNSPHRQAAEQFLALLLSPEGRAVLERNGQTPIVPALAAPAGAVPPSLARWCSGEATR